MWTGRTPAGIPMVPDELTEATFYGREDVAALLDEEKYHSDWIWKQLNR